MGGGGGGRKHWRNYHWRELPQVLFLSRQNYVCLEKIYFCRDKTFVGTNCGHKEYNFAVTKGLSRQSYFCRDKHVFTLA